MNGEAGQIASRDGTPIAWFRQGSGPPLVLVHGTTADHTTWRVVGPMLAREFTVYAADRRGRGASGDSEFYSIEREYEDVAAVVDAIGGPVDVLGHSFGGRCALGAATLSANVRRVIVYEGPIETGPGSRSAHLLERLEALHESGDRERLLETFLTEAVGLTADEWAAFRSSEVWPLRLAAAHTVIRELRAGGEPAASLDRYAQVRQPVLQLVGGASPPFFLTAAEGLNTRLADSCLVVIDGAKHGAHHTDPDRFVAEIRAFLHGPSTISP